MAIIKPVYSKIPQKGAVDYNTLGGKVGIHADRIADIDTLHTEVETVGSVATINFTGIPVVDQTIELVDTDGVGVTYTAKAATDTANNEFESQTSAAHCASSLKDCIEASEGQFGKFTIEKAGELLTLTQTKHGVLGNKSNTSSLANCTASNFTGGVDGVEGEYDESAEAIAALTAGYAEDAADAKVLEHARKRVLGYI
jgi:hypothetical protein